MIPNCRGCKEELICAYECQGDDLDVGLEGMNEKGHCSMFWIDENGDAV